ncbi:hypothetical protein OPKNFCMD_2485 [Methylobacterium crusticola]|uniref:DUF805 domain-containing protein n=1 Tax=Methylobacterium crusticola TaxID=1697972 RepID=A0ABQ4QWJ6_9HYPH|nr:DUF805 domain-containing protein [Methylobacterium crusticola]GJD49752.1 hypothetical protein OPKNFCMD_2485 [Methylobacterium crusticola]
MLETAARLGQLYLGSMRRYAVFRGRSKREELWAFVIVCLLLTLAARSLDRLLGPTGSPFIGCRQAVQWLHVIPLLSLLARRAHDLDRAGYWLLWPPIWTAVFRVRGEPGPNRFGPGSIESRQASGSGTDGEAAVDTAIKSVDRLRSPRWYRFLMFGGVISFFGGVMLYGEMQHAPNPNRWIAVTIGISALAVGAFLLRCARMSYVGRKAPVPDSDARRDGL